MGDAAYWGKLVNLEAALRKSSLIPFGLFSPDDNMAFLAGPGSSGDASITTESPSEVPDGVIIAFTFTAPPQYLIWNGQWLVPPGDFTVSGNQATMQYPPGIGDHVVGVV